MLSYIIKRVLSLTSALFVVSAAVFLAAYTTPGGPATAPLGMEVTPEAIADLNAQLGLDRPFSVQYVDWSINMLHGDQGQSCFLQTTVLDVIGEYFVPTFSLTVFAQLTSLVIVVSMGVLTAYRRGTSVDIITISISLSGIAVPGFLLSMFLMLFLDVHLKWLPVAGYVQLSRGLLEHLRYLLLPVLSLGAVQAAHITRMSRSVMLNVLHMNYVHTARVKGLRESAVALVYGLKNAGLTILTVVGQSFNSLVTGTIVAGTLFNIPGLDVLTMTSITRRDAFAIQDAVLLVILTYVLVNLAVDILYGFVDPRVRLGNKQEGKP